MKYEEIRHLSEEQFRRLTGVKRLTFNRMIDILQKEFVIKNERGGRPNKVSVSDMLLMTLEYLREYRTYFHIASIYGVTESTAYKTIKWVEDVLIRDGSFSLPGRKELLKIDNPIEVVLIDASESPIEHPKKTEAILFRQEKKTYIKNTNSCR